MLVFKGMCVTKKSRLEKYQRKFNYIVSKLSRLPPDLSNEFMFDALLYRLHTSIDALMDIVAMLVKDFGEEVKDDYTNIETLSKIGAIPKIIETKLKRLNGLRNAIVHKYNGFNESVIKENLEEIIEDIFHCLQVLEDVVKKIFG